MDFYVPRYGSVLDFLLERCRIGAKTDEFEQRFDRKVRKRTVTRHTEVREVHKNPLDPKLCTHSEYELRNVISLRNREL